MFKEGTISIGIPQFEALALATQGFLCIVCRSGRQVSGGGELGSALFTPPASYRLSVMLHLDNFHCRKMDIGVCFKKNISRKWMSPKNWRW